MKNILLTNAMGPYDLGWGEDMTDLFGARLTRGQGPFSMRGYFHAFALFLIAENLKARTTILEHPDEKIFKNELKKNYDYIGLQIVGVHVPRIAKMVRIIRQVSPATKIVIGGYGVSMLYSPPPNDPEDSAGYILDQADHICREEGVGFFRKIIGQDPNEPITQLHVPPGLSTLRGMENMAMFPTTSTLVSLGCPNACEFCNTSAFFRFKKITVISPKEVVESLKAHVEKADFTSNMFNILWDEDYLINKSYVMEVADLLQKENLIGKVSIFTFASIRSISKYTPLELVLAGIGTLWIGVESKYDEVVTSVHKFKKRSGRDVAQVFDELHSVGIQIIGSNILGLDFHTPDNIEEDIDYFVSLKPDLYQVAPLTPCPGTMLYDRMKEEGRLYSNFSFEHVQIWSDKIFKHHNFGDGEIKHYFDLCHKKLYEVNGPSVLNVGAVQMQGYRNMVHSKNPHLQAWADRCYLDGKYIMGDLLYAIKKLAPSEAVKKRAEQIKKQHVKYFGNPILLQKAVQKFIYKKVEKESRKTERDSDPPWELTQYNGDGSAPRRLKRRNPIRARLQETSRALVKKFLTHGMETDRDIRLVDIDDFSVDFKTVEIEGDLINYVDEGSGKTLLMIHGNPTWSYLYRHLIKDLKTNYRCVAIDLLGYGLSDKPPNADYSMDAHIRRLGQFIEKLDLTDITLICQDWGGIIGLSYASRNKEKFTRLIPMNTCGFLPENLSEVLKCSGAWAFPYLWSYKIPVLGKRMAMDWNVFLKSGLKFGVYNTKKQMHKRAMAGYLYPFQRPHERTAIMKSVRQVPMGMFGPTVKLLKQTRKDLEGWNIRTQVIWGMQDPVFVPWFIDKFEELLPNHALSIKIPTAGHFLQDDEPELIIAGIRRFLGEKAINAPSARTAPKANAI